MSHNENLPRRSARRHQPALWALAVAVGLAFVALMVMARDGTTDPVGVAPAEIAPVSQTVPSQSTPMPDAN